MICGNKQDIEKILPYVSEGLQKALQYIKETVPKVSKRKIVLTTTYRSKDDFIRSRLF